MFLYIIISLIIGLLAGGLSVYFVLINNPRLLLSKAQRDALIKKLQDLIKRK